MPGQNFTSLGIDVSSFTPEKENILNKFIILFEKLSLYDGKTINPVFGPGLVEFNTSVTATNTLLTELNTKLTSLTSALNGTSGGSTRAAAANKALTAETAALKVQLQEANKALLDQAKANNATVQAREAQKKSIADQKRLEKELADLVLQTDRQIAESKKRRANIEKELIVLDKQKVIADQEVIRTQQQEARTTEKLISDYKLLKQAQQDQATNYANLFIAKGGAKNNAGQDPAVIAAFNQLQETSRTVGEIEKGLDKATNASGAFGNSLTRGLSTLRTLAYILPGIGIAGIFNIAFEAINKAFEAAGVFNSEEQKTAENSKIINGLLKERYELLSNIFDKLSTAKSLDPYGLERQIKEFDIAKSRGIAKDLSLPEDVKFAEQASKKAEADMKAAFGSERDINRVMDERLKEVAETEKKIRKLNDIEENIANIRQKAISKKGVLSIEEIALLDDTKAEKTRKSQREGLESELALNNEKFNTLKGYAERYYNTLDGFEQKRADLFKFTAEEDLKTTLELSKTKISLKQKENDIILNKEISDEQEKVNAINAIGKGSKDLIAADLKNILDNTETTKKERLVAITKAGDETRAVEEETEQKILKLREQYRQQRLTAQSNIDQSEINAAAVRDERIANNETNSLQERLSALVRYIDERQKLQDIQLVRELDQAKYKTGDVTADKLLEEQQKKAAEQKLNIQADVEKKVYDIVYQFTQAKLKLILDENKIDIKKNRERYGEEVRALTDSFRDRKISYSRYKKELKQVDDQYDIEALEKTIKQDEDAVKRLRENLIQNVLLLSEADEKVERAKSKAGTESKGLGITLATQEELDTANGLYKGYLKAVQSDEVSLSDAQEKLDYDRFKRNNKRLNEDTKARRQYIQAIRQVEQALYQAIKQYGDQEYDYRREQLQLRKQTIDEQYGYEIAAIEKSSLTAKDKAALDIQLQAQQHQYDVENQKEQKRIAHDKAVFDRDLAIAHIILSTAEAVASLIAVPVLAIAAGIAGGTELVIAENVRIPSYAKGIKSKPESGWARFGEDGSEIIKEPYKSPYLVSQETIGYLPRGTRVIPINDNPELGGSVPKDESWRQFMWLAKQFKKTQQPRPINNIYINLGFESFKTRVLGR